MKMSEEKGEGADARGDRTAWYDVDLGVSGSWAANGEAGGLGSAIGKGAQARYRRVAVFR